MDTTIKIVLAAIAVMLLIGIKVWIDDRKEKKKLREMLIRTWGKPSDRNYSDEQWQAICAYYRSEPELFDVDDITWNDLAMDDIYIQWNHTKTSIGEEYLYSLLRRPVTEPEEMAERERIISFLQEHEEERLSLQTALAEIGKLERMSVYRHLQQVKDLPPGKKLSHILNMVALLLCLGLCAFRPDIMVTVSIVVMGYNIITYYMAKSKIETYLRLFTFILRMVYQCEALAEVDIPELKKYLECLQKAASCFDKYRRFSFLVEGGKRMSGDLLDSLMDYLRMVFHLDLIKIGTMIHEAKKYQKQLIEMYETIGYLDSMLSVASCRSMYEVSCVPEMVQDKDRMLETKEMFHPLLPDGVSNDLDTETGILLTGSNASGKSTFIKAVAINAILAQTVHTAVAESYRSSWFHIASSMALRDDILSRESYYIVEIKSLKRIIDLSDESELPILCFIDEVLRGTNTVERIAASSRILESIADRGNLCFAATHDIELTYLLENDFENYHFEEKVVEDEVLFDYHLRKGRACTRNAIRLLKMMGYDEEIVQDAQKRVSKFMDTGAW
ncbi:MAG: hypothetical protein J1E62_09090 [Lachnospiraceae bacterium]|nr:hypothetical protein [Lachnospiraceae bacterium]